MRGSRQKNSVWAINYFNFFPQISFYLFSQLISRTNISFSNLRIPLNITENTTRAMKSHRIPSKHNGKIQAQSFHYPISCAYFPFTLFFISFNKKTFAFISIRLSHYTFTYEHKIHSHQFYRALVFRISFKTHKIELLVIFPSL